MHRVVVTGMGLLTPLGSGLEQFRESLEAGVCGLRPLQEPEFETLNFGYGGRLKEYSGSDHFSAKELPLLDPFAQYLTVCSRQAWQNSGLEMSARQSQEMAVVMGSASGGQVTIDQESQRLYKDGRPRLRPVTIPRSMLNAGASRVCKEFAIQGPCYSVSTACSSGTHAIGQAFHMIKMGQVQSALTGASEAPFCYGYLKAWEALRVVDPEICRPFSEGRAGLNLGEGAAVLVLEELGVAKERGAHIHAEVVGFGMSSDASDLTKPNISGAALSMQRALREAEVDAVDYINAHGTGTRLNDATEVAAIREVLGSKAQQIPVSSNKSMFGHLLGAAGAVEAVATILALEKGVVPPTLHLDKVDPDFGLDFVPNQAREVSLRTALSNSFAFGGLNGTLVFRRFES